MRFAEGGEPTDETTVRQLIPAEPGWRVNVDEDGTIVTRRVIAWAVLVWKDDEEEIMMPVIVDRYGTIGPVWPEWTWHIEDGEESAT